MNKLLTIGLGFYLGFEYYFTEQIGIAAAITENPAAYSIFVTKGGNIFTLKAGVAFKL